LPILIIYQLLSTELDKHIQVVGAVITAVGIVIAVHANVHFLAAFVSTTPRRVPRQTILDGIISHFTDPIRELFAVGITKTMLLVA
jgi:hypothetical protein